MSLAILSTLKNPHLRVSAAAMLFFGFAGAATSPYDSIVAIEEMHLGNSAYAILIFCAALVNVVASVMAGILADRMGNYRSAILSVSICGVIGFALVYGTASAPAFVLAKLCLLPVFGATAALLFANVHAASKAMSSSQQIAVNSTMRAMISLAWVAVPGLVGLSLAGSASMLPAYLWAAFAALMCFSLALWFLPPAQTARREDAEGHYGTLASLKILAEPRVLLRVATIALIFSMLHVNDAVRSLIISLKAGGSVADIGLVIGIVAFLEIVFILFWGMSERWMRPVTALVIGALLYVAYMILQGLVSATWQAYALTPLSGFAAAAIVSLPITYLQNLIANRPGLGSSLISVNIFLSAGLSAAVFAIGTRIGGYGFTSILGGIIGLVGIVLLILLDGKQSRADT